MSAPTCQVKWYSRGFGGGSFCGAPAAYAVGVLRSCGCPPSPVQYCCDKCIRKTRHDCSLCGAHDTVTDTEPVRLKAAS